MSRGVVSIKVERVLYQFYFGEKRKEIIKRCYRNYE